MLVTVGYLFAACIFLRCWFPMPVYKHSLRVIVSDHSYCFIREVIGSVIKRSFSSSVIPEYNIKINYKETHLVDSFPLRNNEYSNDLMYYSVINQIQFGWNQKWYLSVTWFIQDVAALRNFWRRSYGLIIDTVSVILI